MAKWYKIEMDWNGKKANEIFNNFRHQLGKDPLKHSFIMDVKEEICQDMRFQDRIKIKVRSTDKEPFCVIILKFKNEEDAMAFKLRWVE